MKINNIVKQSLRKFAFELGFLLLIIVGILFLYTGLMLRERSQWVEHTYKVLTNLFDLSSDFERAETSQRGFFISGDEKFLKTYTEAVRKARENILDVTALMGDNALQGSRVEELKNQIQKRISMMDEIIPMRSTDLPRAQKILANPERREFTEKIREQLSLIVAQEEALLRERSERAAQTQILLLVLLLTGGALAVGLILVSQKMMKLDNRRLAESGEKFEKQGQLLDSIINSMSEGLIVIDTAGKYQHINRAAEAVVGARDKVMAVEDISSELGFFYPDTGQKIENADLPSRRALQGVATDEFQILIRNALHPKGIVISANTRPLFDKNGSALGATVVFRDVSRQREIERERIFAREEAIAASGKKSEFLASMSHEIRTPMNGVIGMARLMLDTKLSSEQFEFTSTIKKSAEALLELINGILDHSKIEAGKLVLNKFNFDLGLVTGEIYEMFKYFAKEKNLSLQLQYAKENDWRVNGDGDRVRQILTNLIGNAIKFTENGGVIIRLTRVGESKERVQIRGEVIDTGPGLTEHEAAELFGKYVQTPAGRAKGGSGLGLMITKQLTELMGGEVGVMSEPGEGANFWFEIEFGKAEGPTSIVKVDNDQFPTLSGHVLIVEDQPINVRVVSKFLEKMGLTFNVAVNGKKATELYGQEEFSLVLMDCRMPVMSGYEATKIIREMQKQSGKMRPILALTAEGSSGDRRLCLEAGMDDVLNKPLEVAKFVEVIAKYLGRPGRAIDPAALDKLKNLKVADEDLIAVLVKEFSDSAPLSIQEICEAAEERDLDRLRDCAHALKSTAATLGATRLAKLCQELEDLSGWPADILNRCELLKAEFNLAAEELRRTSAPSSRQAS